MKKSILFPAVFLLTAMFFSPLLWRGVGGEASAQPGTLDPTFGTGGIVTTPVGSGYDDGYSIAIQSDGKIVVAGYTANSINGDFGLIRYNTDGTLDNAFGTGGKVTTDIAINDDLGTSVVIQADGKILMAGSSVVVGNADFALVRYNTNGSLDNSFGSGGIVTTDIANNYDYGSLAAIQTDGKILVAGSSYIGANYDFALVRYNTDGSLDNTFGTGGIVTTPVGSSNDYGSSPAIQTDGKIIVAGLSGNGANKDFTLVRYTTTGSLDNTFGSGGIVTTDFGGADDYGTSAAIQSDGKIVVAGYSYIGSTFDFALVRYNTNGSLDNSFGSSGKVTSPIGSDNDFCLSNAIQNDGKIVLVGYSSSGGGANNYFALVRYTTTGSLDNTFGSGGIVITAIGSASDDKGQSATIQTDGKIMLAGYSYNGANNDFAVARYNGDAQVGIAENTEISAVSVYPNPTKGKIQLSVAGGSSNQYSLEVYNVLGEKVFSRVEGQGTGVGANPSTINHQSSTIDLSSQPDGIYFVQVNTDKGIVAGKVMVLR